MVEAGKGLMPGKRFGMRWRRQGWGYMVVGLLWEREMKEHWVGAGHAEWEIIPN